MVVREQQLTVAEFLAFCEEPENKDRLFELIDGEVIEKVGSFTPSRIAVRIGTKLNIFLDTNDLGYVTGADGTCIMTDDFAPMPDVGYISKARLPQIPNREVIGCPDLAVEIKSPNDTKRALRQKAEMYLRHKTPMVWLIFPDEQLVEVYVQGEDVTAFGIEDTLDGGTILPGFTLPVRDLFR